MAVFTKIGKEQANRLNRLDGAPGRKIARRIGTWTLIGAVAYTTYFARDAIRDAAHDPSAQEQMIEHALESAYDMDVHGVRCLDDGPMAAQRNPFFPWPRLPPNLGAVPYAPTPWSDNQKHYLPYARLHQKVCNDLTDFRRNPPQHSWEVDNDLLAALQTGSHEARHLGQVANESQADCEAIQTIGDFAIALGASVEAATEIQTRNTRFIKDDRDASALEQCYPLGPYDLGRRPMHFPYRPPGTPDRNQSVRAGA